jgi:hypothetical protein
MFLRDTSPSIFKRAPDMNGLVTSNLPYTILTGCVRPTKSRLPNVFKRPQQWTRKTMKRPVNNFAKWTIGSLLK